jgi:TRAP-type C4-dicarboxylate transport system substrate-binding protein
MSVPFLRLLIVLAALVLTAPIASALTLKIATVVPDGSSWLVEMRKAGVEIQERTEGRVKLKFYPGGVMGNDKTVLRKVRAGQLQGGAFTSGALAAIYPDIELYSLPLLFRGYEEVDLVRAELDKQLMDGLAEKGFVALSITDGGFAYVLSQKPMGKVEDMSGAKFWLVEDDKMTEIALELAGVSPVPLPIADVYTALQTGLIDTVAAPPMGAIAFQWHTKVRYLTDEPLMYLAGVVALDQKAFDKLSPEDRAVVREVVAAAGERLDAESRAGEDNARDALRNQGIEFVKPSSAQEVRRWHDISAEAIEKLRAMERYDDATIQKIQSILQSHRTGPAATQ